MHASCIPRNAAVETGGSAELGDLEDAEVVAAGALVGAVWFTEASTAPRPWKPPSLCRRRTREANVGLIAEVGGLEHLGFVAAGTSAPVVASTSS
jgi:hypothetical protein